MHIVRRSENYDTRQNGANVDQKLLIGIVVDTLVVIADPHRAIGTNCQAFDFLWDQSSI
jgi:hypothetical protein